MKLGPLLLPVLLLPLACLKVPQEDKAKKRPEKVAVNLPPVPSVLGKRGLERHPDGALTVEGFVRHASDLLKTKDNVTVRGVVKSVERCPEGQDLCPTVPHVVLVDNLASPRFRMVVVSDPEEAILQGFQVGETKTLTGQVVQQSPSGRLIDLKGLLLIRPEPYVTSNQTAE